MLAEQRRTRTPVCVVVASASRVAPQRTIYDGASWRRRTLTDDMGEATREDKVGTRYA